MTIGKVGNGFSFIFWNDLWCSTLLSTKFPRLLSYAREKLASVHDICSIQNLHEAFHFPFSIEAFIE